MKTLTLNRHSPLSLTKYQTLKNRVVVPAMASQTADENGFVTTTTIEHYQNLAKSDAGLIYLEYTYVHRTGRSEPQQLGISSDLHIAGLAKIAQAIKATGALVGIQLTHAGGKTSRDLTGGALMGSSNISVPVKDLALEKPDPMSTADIQLWIEAFVLAAHRSAQAGFDLVELHAAHGYGLNQWLSPITNHRNDEYGGTLQNRLLLLSTIIQKIKAIAPQLLISVRIPGRDFLEEGLSLEDGIKIAQHLESLGVDIINVSSGIGGWRRPRDRVGQGYLLQEATAIQNRITAPVIGVGGIETGNFIDDLIAHGDVQLAAVGRAILQNPQQWGESNLSLECSEQCSNY